MAVGRRAVVAGAVGLAVSACASRTGITGQGSPGPTPLSSASASPPAPTPSTSPSVTPSATPTSPKPTPGAPQLIGDGSTSRTGPQPRQKPVLALKPGETPPQFVVVSWDGCAELPSQLMARFRKVSEQIDATMTMFLSGLYLVAEQHRTTYLPPGRAPGASSIEFLKDASCRRTITAIGAAWREGHEIGTHFNGHFCGATGVESWSTADWRQEIDEAVKFVTTWKTINGYHDLPALPFDCATELVGGRTPCLEGSTALMPEIARRKWRYDSSRSRLATWPKRNAHGLWDLSMTMAPFRGGSREVIPMDYTYMVLQSGKQTSDPTHRDLWRREVVESLLAGLERSRTGNRAPFVIGNHFNHWNGGIYMDAVEQFMLKGAQLPGVQFVTFRWLCDWLEAQRPEILTALQALPVGRGPRGGWAGLAGA